MPFESFVLTSFQRKYYDSVRLNPFVESIRSAIQSPQPTDLDTLLQVLRECVARISFLTKRSKHVRSSIAAAVVSKIDLFTALAGPDEDISPETLEVAAADLASYIVVKQTLLYFLLTPTLRLPRLIEVHSIGDLKTAFERITNVDYQAVYRVDVVRELPEESVPELNKIITALKNLRPEDARYDLLGRMFHEFLPLGTRKLFATFYTKPSAAEFLANIAIADREDSQAPVVLEPSVGSGTILAAVYNTIRRKFRLTHNHVLRNLFALDWMPFAAHLAALNLTLQDLSEGPHIRPRKIDNRRVPSHSIGSSNSTGLGGYFGSKTKRS